MPETATWESFERELARLVETFERNLAHYKSARYDEASLRQEFLNPFFRALGWDVENKAGLIPQHRQVEIESRTQVGARQNRADYLFRTHPTDRFICEAKKPAEELHARYVFQAKCYAWNKGLPLAILTDFEELKVFIVGGRPVKDEPDTGLWKTWRFRDYPQVARDIWDLLARERVAAGGIDQLIESLPRKAPVKGRKGFILKPDRSRALDADFLSFLDEARRELAGDLLKHNDRADLLEGTRLNEAVQRILDRLLFLRICDARDIDTGRPLERIVRSWREAQDDEPLRPSGPPSLELHEEPPAHCGGSGLRAPKGTLWHGLVRHFRALDRRPPSHMPFFNGNLFKPHFCEELVVGDVWLAHFLDQTGDEESPYRFNYIPVEILGTIYERFLGKVVRPHGRGVTIEEKPEVRKAGGVYYTPRYIVEYIVAQTVGALLKGRKPEEALQVRVLDPACGSGSFLIRAFEAVCEHCQQWLTDDLRRAAGDEATSPRLDGQDQRLPASSPAAEKWLKKHRDWCWVEANAIHLTTRAKRRILRETIYGVDLDPQAVEVTQLSLYLKMLEGENRFTLARERDLFGGEEALLPPLENNIKCGNSLIASDFSVIPEDLVRVRAFDWPVQFPAIMKAGGFDAVIGNPPYVRIQTMQETDAEAANYLNRTYAAAKKGNYDLYVCFVERGLKSTNDHGKLGFILPHKFTNSEYGQPLRNLISTGKNLSELVHFGANQVFEGATTYTCLMFLKRIPQDSFQYVRVDDLTDWATSSKAMSADVRTEKVTAESWSFTVGKAAPLIDRLMQMSPTLGDVADIFVGLQTSADDVFILDFVSESPRLLTLRSEALETEVTVEKELLHPMVSGTDVQSYSKFDNRQFVIFPYTVTETDVSLIPFLQLKKRCPRLAAYLERNKPRLSQRENGRMRGPDWYGYIYLKNMRRQAKPKVCVPRLVDRLCASLDAQGTHYLDNVDVGGVTFTAEYQKHDLRYLVALLNSSLLAWFFPNVSAPFRGGWMSANRQFLSHVPFRQIDFSNGADRARHDRLVGLVDKMLVLVPKLRTAKSEAEKATLQNAVTATDQQIDALVYELYGLTDEEIRLVESQ
jgi:hypothetical protein